jgi:hypothetical protein
MSRILPMDHRSWLRLTDFGLIPVSFDPKINACARNMMSKGAIRTSPKRRLYRFWTDFVPVLDWFSRARTQNLGQKWPKVAKNGHHPSPITSDVPVLDQCLPPSPWLASSSVSDEILPSFALLPFVESIEVSAMEIPNPLHPLGH